MVIKEGAPAPLFELPDDQGETTALADLAGRKVVLYFYPKDDTPGCTIEACDFRDRMDRLQQEGAVVLGVSPDPVERHRKFREKYGLTFPLLADTEHTVAEAYGAWGEKKRYGRTYHGIIRSTFLIDQEGVVRKVWSPVTVKGHAEQVLKAIAELEG